MLLWTLYGRPLVAPGHGLQEFHLSRSVRRTVWLKNIMEPRVRFFRIWNLVAVLVHLVPFIRNQPSTSYATPSAPPSSPKTSSWTTTRIVTSSWVKKVSKPSSTFTSTASPPTSPPYNEKCPASPSILRFSVHSCPPCPIRPRVNTVVISVLWWMWILMKARAYSRNK